MRGRYSARGQIGTGPVRAALAGPARALHSIVGWDVAKTQHLFFQNISKIGQLHEINVQNMFLCQNKHNNSLEVNFLEVI